MNLFYLLLAFPLGIFYFVFLVTGVSLGVGLAITLIGIPLLILMSFLWYWIGIFEGQLTSSMLDIDILPIRSGAFEQKNFLQIVMKHLSEPITWRSFAYLLFKFPMGILSFVSVVVLISLSLSMFISPFIYYSGVDYFEEGFIVLNGNPVITADWQVFVLSILGILLLFISLHILNGLAYVSGMIAKSFLSKRVKRRGRRNGWKADVSVGKSVGRRIVGKKVGKKVGGSGVGKKRR